VIDDGAYSFHKVNAHEQKTDESSLLTWTTRIIRARKEAPELGWGDWEVLETGNNSVLGIRYNWRNNSVVTLHNCAGEAVEIELHLGDAPGRRLVNLLAKDHSDADHRGRHHIILEPYGYRWFRVGGLGYLLDRTDY
jgi:maltose alpha-D-glucosyltransferase/alpha-amylase